MIKNADAELCERLSRGGGPHGWKQSEAADAIRNLRSDELEAAVIIGWQWVGDKAWETDLLASIRHATNASDFRAQQIMKRLAADGFLDEAHDLDYSKISESAWCDGSILWILRRAARRSGLFPALPPPRPERLSSLLIHETAYDITGKGWYGARFAEPILTAVDAIEKAVAVVARLTDPVRTWVFRSPEDRAPLKAERYFTPAGLLLGQLATTDDVEVVGFELAIFDDLGLLTD